MEIRTNSALLKRTEQLKRWDESETNKESHIIKEKIRKTNFPDSCIFLAACSVGDKEEVLRLLEKGANIDTPNIDGLTALHQACIDNNLDMVEFLLDHGANINKCDNEGWTPLHATASCGFVSIAKYLIERGADIIAVNNDGDLSYDIAECDSMEEYLMSVIESKGLDCDSARNKEQKLMLEDVQRWIRQGFVDEQPHTVTGATALHVAASKGYINVLSLLLKTSIDINVQDYDGWTPLHAAAHWNQREACQLLADNFCNFKIQNYMGQTAFDVADSEILPYLEELSKIQATRKELPDVKAKLVQTLQYKKIPPNKLIKNSLNIEDKTKLSAIKCEYEHSDKEKKKNLEIDKKNQSRDNDSLKIIHDNKQMTEPLRSVRDERVVAVASVSPWRRNDETKQLSMDGKDQKSPSKDENEIQDEGRMKKQIISEEEDRMFNDIQEKLKERSWKIVSIHDNEKSNVRSANSSTQITEESSIVGDVTSTQLLPPPLPLRNSSTPVVSSQEGSRFSFFSKLFKSFIPPVRDEESETQRKAHAKRVRETRRSTQGVTLEEIKNAQQFMKDRQNIAQNKESAATIHNAVTDNKENKELFCEKRPSWRLRLDDGDKTKFTLEDENVDTKTVCKTDIGNISPETEVSVSLPLRQRNLDNEENLQSVQMAIHRRRRPKRRSTGILQADGQDEETEKILDRLQVENELYNELLKENEKLIAQVKMLEIKCQENLKQHGQQGWSSETEKREKRALERKLSEMEEELKALLHYKTENEQLKQENRALVRVITKLSK